MAGTVLDIRIDITNYRIGKGSAIGQVLYVINAAWHLYTVTPGNSLMKYADNILPGDTGLFVDTRDKEIANICAWATANNVTLNASKSLR